jgi:hypothetical protein
MRLSCNRRGYNLVSVIVATAILAIAVTMAASTFISASRVAKGSADFTVASNYAEGVMERIRLEPFDRVKTTNVTNHLPALPSVKCEIEVAAQSPGLKQVTVTCSWAEGRRARHVRFSTLLAKGGVR